MTTITVYKATENDTQHLSQAQKGILQAIQTGDKTNLLRYEWVQVYNTLQTLKALFVVDYDSPINYPEQIGKIMLT